MLRNKKSPQYTAALMENANGIAIFKSLQYGQGKMRLHHVFLHHPKIIYSCFGQEGLQILSFHIHFLDAKYLYKLSRTAFSTHWRKQPQQI